jgi:bifunctional enzyme CysN/CysC
MAAQGGMVRFLSCGSVDDGKSTLIGHLIHLTGNLHDDQLRTLQEESSRIGTAGGALDYSLLMDGLLAEREQGITIDVAYRYFACSGRKFIVADTPGHEQYTRNMATGASQCNAAIILIDACQGVLAQTRRHALICSLMGIRHLLFVVNKMDRTDWRQSAYAIVEQQCADLAEGLQRFGLPPAALEVVPVSALLGDNLSLRSPRMPWYHGSTVLDWLLRLPGESVAPDAPLRLPVQYVIKLSRSGISWQKGVPERLKTAASGTYRAYAGVIASGGVRRGDPLLVLPAGHAITVQEIWCGKRQLDQASEGMSIALTVSGEHDILRGDCIVSGKDRPELADRFKVRLVWMDDAPLYAGRHYLFRGVGGVATAEVTRLRNRIELGSYQRLACDRLDINDIGDAELALSRAIAFDPYLKNRETGGFVLIDRFTNATAACGLILHALRRAENIHWHVEDIGPQERSALKRQKPCVVWMTGLSGSGKSTLANAVERRLAEEGRHTMLLDGDNLRHGLNKDLGFTEADRIENIRRIGEVAKLMTEAGLIVITAFISPYRSEREIVRNLLPRGQFIEVHLATPLEVCEERDPKGLYRKARGGEIPNFTGIDAPYEEPEEPELRIDTSSKTVEECAAVVCARLGAR